MRVLQFAFVLVIVGCTGTTLVESADVPVVDVALDFNPTDGGVADTGADAGGCPPGFTCTPLDASTDAGQLGADAGTNSGLDVPPVDTGVDVQAVDTRVDVAPLDTGVDVPPACVSMTVGNCAGVACHAPPNGTAACGACVCTLGTCNAGFADCDHNPTNGCEVNLATDPMNCGTCGAACAAVTAPNETTACAAMVCGFACAYETADCDGNPANGCEVQLRSDSDNCGHCGEMCPAHFSCQTAVCVRTS